MSKELILVAAIGAAVLLVVNKQAQARNAAPAQVQGYVPAQRPVSGVPGDMWTRLLGEGWQYLKNAQNADGSPAFLKNVFGQVTTSDGKPVGGDDPLSYFSPIVESVNRESYPTDFLGMISPLDKYLDGGQDLLGW